MLGIVCLTAPPLHEAYVLKNNGLLEV